MREYIEYISKKNDIDISKELRRPIILRILLNKIKIAKFFKKLETSLLKKNPEITKQEISEVKKAVVLRLILISALNTKYGIEEYLKNGFPVVEDNFFKI